MMRSTRYSYRAAARLFAVLMLLLMVGMSTAPGPVRVFAESKTPPEQPSGLQAVPPSLFGADMPTIDQASGLDYMVQAGSYWVRPVGVYWSVVQPQENQPPDWSALVSLDTEIQNAADNGMQVILKVQSSPDWARAITDAACGPVAVDHLADLGDFMFALVNRYKDSVVYWELWNEPDIDPDLLGNKDGQYGCWGDEDDDYYGGRYYAEMLKVVSPRIKEADPNAQVLVGGLLLDCDPNRVCPDAKSARFLEGILLNQGGAYFDGISYHAYDYYLGSLGQYFNDKWQSSWDTTGPVTLTKAAYLRNVLKNAGLTDKYLINTEAAVVCDSGCDDVFQATKANYLAQSFASSFAADLRANLWYSTRAYYRNTDLFGPGVTPLPAYYAYQFSQSQLYNAEYIGQMRAYTGVKGYEFRQSDCPNPGEFCRLWVIWSQDGIDQTIELPDVPYAVFDRDGDPLIPQIRQLVTLEPIYVRLPPNFQVRLPELVSNFSVLANGDFEAGTNLQGDPVGWQVVSGGQGLPASIVDKSPTVPADDPEIPLGGSSLLLGSTDFPCSPTGVPIGYAAVEQTITVPSTSVGGSPTLEFSYVIYTWDGGSSDNYDRFEVYIDDGTGSKKVYYDGRENATVSCSNWYRLPQTGWQTASIDLTQFMGKTIRISFQNWNRTDHWYNTFTYLDNVRFVDGS